MDKFKTYSDLMQYLKGHTDLCMTLQYLQDKVKEEIAFLVKDSKKKHSTLQWKSSKKAEVLGEISKAAKEDYLEDINYFLLNNAQLSHMFIMGYRRKQHAWAIAQSILEYEDV